MLDLDRTLSMRLQEKRICIEVPDNNTILLRNVPTNERFFSKNRTNLLVKRPRSNMPFVVFVDIDLEYVGADSALAGVFSGSIRQEGWRAVLLGHICTTQRNCQKVVENALAVLGFDGKNPTIPVPEAKADSKPEASLLHAFGVNLSHEAKAGSAESTIGRTDEIEGASACLLRWGQTRMALITGESGVGKSNLLHAVARKLSASRPELSLICIDLARLLAGTLFDAESENLLAALLEEAAASPEIIVALEHLEQTLAIPRGGLLLAHALDKGAELAGTILPGYLRRFSADPLARRLHVIELAEPQPAEAAAILISLRQNLTAHHHIEITDSCMRLCIKAALPLAGCFPAKAIAVIDAAASRAALAGAKSLSADDIFFAASRCPRCEALQDEL